MSIVMMGAPVGVGAGRRGCEGGPAALRKAGIREALSRRGLVVMDLGDIACGPPAPVSADPARRHLPEVVAWSHAIHDAVASVAPSDIPLILGGDHSLSLGTLPALAARAAAAGRPFFVLWLDAHPDCHTLRTTISGNLHGLPLAHALGAHGARAPFPSGGQLQASHVLILGVRDVDPAEAAFMRTHDVAALGPQAIRAEGLQTVIEPWLRRIASVGGLLHVSLDADVLDPALAPGVGTPVPGGMELCEITTIMRLIGQSGLLGSLELAEVNPFLDRDQRTAEAMVACAVEALGRPRASQRRQA